MAFQAQIISLATILAVASTLPLIVIDSPPPTTDVTSAAHGGGVLQSVCVNMTPSHGGSVPQTNLAPFVMTVSKRSALPGDNVQVILYGKNHTTFKGVYIQGRSGDVPVGQFLPSGPNTPPVTLTDCPPGSKNAASYISSSQPLAQLILSYVVPTNVPAVVFRATFVRSYTEFWTDVFSDEILVTST